MNYFRVQKSGFRKRTITILLGMHGNNKGLQLDLQRKMYVTLLKSTYKGGLDLLKGDNIEIIPCVTVFIGSKHTYQNHYVLVNSSSVKNKILIASDAIWTYYNLNNLLSIPYYVFDSKAYVEAMIRMKSLVSNTELIIPGHDDLVFSKFKEVANWIVKIEE